MIRGYRSIILAFGLILASAQQPTEQAQTDGGAGQQQTSPAQAATPSPSAEPTYQPYPGYDPDPCYRAEHHDSADLCAQWRAAIAAEKAAHEARRATTWGIVATILTVLTVFGLIYSIWQTHRALGEARRGNRLNLMFEKRSRRESREAAAAQERALAIADNQFRLSEKSAKIQLRAYLVVDRIEPFQVSGDSLSVKIFIKNVGQTPAKNTKVKAIMWLGDSLTNDPITIGPNPNPYLHFIDVLSQGSEDSILSVCVNPEIGSKLNENDRADAYVYGRVEFADVFDDTHWMTFAYCPVLWGFDVTTKFRPCIHGNGSD